MSAGEDDVATFYLRDNIVKLSGDNSVIERSIVVHAGNPFFLLAYQSTIDVDDLGVGPHTDSTVNGHVGARLACW